MSNRMHLAGQEYLSMADSGCVAASSEDAAFTQYVGYGCGCAKLEHYRLLCLLWANAGCMSICKGVLGQRE